MIRAAVLPYVRPRPGAGGHTGGSVASVLVHDGEKTIEARSFEVGRLVCIEHGAWPCAACSALPTMRGVLRFRREVGALDVGAVVSAMVTLFRKRKVEHVAIEAAQGAGIEAERARWISRELMAALTDVAHVDLIDSSNVKRSDIAGRASAILRAPGSTSLSPAAIETARDLAAELGVGLAVNPAVMAAAPAMTAPTTTATGPRIAGIDPGAHWVAVTIGAGEVAPLHYVASRVFNVGRLVPLAKPKTMKTADGKERVITARRVIEDDDIDAVLSEIVVFLHSHDVERVAVERATHFHGGDAPANVKGARSAMLLRAQWIGGEIAGALRAANVKGSSAGETRRMVSKVESVSSKVWRSLARKMWKCREWREGVALAFGGTLPAAPGEHALDAAGVAAWGVRPKSTPRKRAEPRAGALPEAHRDRSNMSRNGARQDATKARRAALGCTCEGRRHVQDCPVRIAANKARRAKMTGNANARKAPPPPSPAPRAPRRRPAPSPAPARR